jgi:hypothetical protein
MNAALVDKIVNSVLYEGYMLYPYRNSSIKNRHRWNFGILYPEGYNSEPSTMTTECLVHGEEPAVGVAVRFLQSLDPETTEERRVQIPSSPENRSSYASFGDLSAAVEITSTSVGPQLSKYRIVVANRTACDGNEYVSRDAILRRSLISTHTILTVENGEFISLLDPPEEFRNAALNCKNVGTWPVLVGRESERDCILSSPIVLYDYPQVAPESAGDLFDSLEIDEILTLRVLTLSDEEKEQMRNGDERARRILERTESLTPEELLALHGTMRDIRVPLKRGDRVLLRPKPGGDVFDIVLNGRTAIVESVEQDFEDRTHIAVIIEDDPGRDLGLMRQPGHRFFFSAEEVELLP